MRRGRLSAMATGAVLSLAACSGGGGSSVLSDPPVPTLTSTATSPAAVATHHRHHPASRVSTTPKPSASTSTPMPAATHSPAATTQSPAHRPSPTRSPSPSRHPSPSPTAACAGVTGTTTTIQEQSGDKFVPSTVAISRCDSVKAVYSDTTGTPHTFTGPGWDSGGMSSTGKSSYTYQFASKGTFDFYCTYHKSIGMTGTITVS